MKPLGARITKGINIGSELTAADNSGARVVRVVSIIGGKGRKGKQVNCGVGNLIKVSVRKGDTEMKGKTFHAVIVRQRKEYRRLTGERISFSDNAAVLLKDDVGNPKGTQVKGAISRESADRWPFVAKIASVIV